MSEISVTRFKNWGVICTAALSILAVFSTFVASPKDIAEIGRRIAVIELSYEDIEKRSKSDHDVLTRIEANQVNQLQMLRDLQIQIRNSK